MKKKWNVKKSICLGALILNYLPFLCYLFPVYVVKGPPLTYHYFYEYLAQSEPFRIVSFIVSYALFFILITVASVFFIKAIRAEPFTGDDEDKGYVFGFVFLILGNTILGITTFGQSNYIPMVWSLSYILIGVGLIVFHYKRLSVA